MINRNEAQRFLTQASFGASESDIDALVALNSYDAWIDQQWALPVSLTQPYVEAVGSGGLRPIRHHIWWQNAMEQPDQLRQRVAFALSELFVVSDLDYTLGNAQFGISQYYDRLAQYADGNYRDLLEVVTLHPVMGIYLSMLRNVQADPERNVRPDENFAREVLQLFSIGLVDLDLDGTPVLDDGEVVPTFDQVIIEEFARVFTGWNFNGETAITSNDLTGYDKTQPMWAVAEHHDHGAKTLLGGEQIPAGLTPEADMARALDNIFMHGNVGPFVSKFLIQRLVTSNPSPAYVERVASVFNNDGTGERGNLGEVVRAILLDTEARNGYTDDNFGKVKEPVLRLTQFWRALNAIRPAGTEEWRPYASSSLGIDSVAGQAVLRSPSVFNFFQPSFSPPETDLLAPEMQIHTEATVGAMNNVLHSCTYAFNTRDYGYEVITRIDVEREVGLASNVDALIDHLDELFLAGLMPAAQRTAMRTHLNALPNTPDGHFARALDAVFMTAASPACMVQR